MIVMKFGGTSLGSAERIKKTAEIISTFKTKNPVVVVSAVGGITDKLIDAIKKAFNQDQKNIAEIVYQHNRILKELNLDRKLLDDELNELSEILDAVIKIKDNSNRIIDIVSSFGERMSSKILAAYLNSINIKSEKYDAYDVGFVTNSDFGNAELLPQAYDHIKNFFSKTDVLPIVTGFIAKDKQGQITTLGRGGSDYTAAVIGAALNVEEIQIWTDVDGMMTCDPKIVKNSKRIDKISFNEAAELATFGAKVLHPKTILPAVKKNIPVKILNSFNPVDVGTTIFSECINCEGIVKAISVKKNITLLNINSTRMLHAHGFLAMLFEIFNKHNISIDMIATSEINVSLTIDGENNKEGLCKTIEELQKIGDITIEKNKSIICLVGNGMKNSVGLSSKIFSIIEKNNINIEMISQGASEINVGFIVDGKDTEKAVKCLHNNFFGG